MITFRALRKAILTTIPFIIIFLSLAVPVEAGVLTAQTTEYSGSLTVWQAIQELGDNLSGPPGTFTFRVKTSEVTASQQFDFTAQNSEIFDKTVNSSVAYGCVPTGSPGADRLRGLIFNTQGVPPGYTDVTIDFSCRNYSFIPGHKYLIKITNANICNGCIKFAAAPYGGSNTDYFTLGGLRYGNGNIFDILRGGGSCHPDRYIWQDPTVNPVSGCYIWTSPKDDLYFILTDNTPVPTPTPTPTLTPTPTPTPIPSKTPLIIIPGIGGSEFKVALDTFWSKEDGHGGVFNRAYSSGEKVWVNELEAANPGNDDYFDILRMQSDGITPEANLELTGNLFPGAYQPTIDFFTSNGYTLNKDLFIFPYDWRKDLSLTAPLLDQKINEIKTQTGAQKVDIISHSMGGLVARNYISDSTRAQKVRKLITLGTPHLGSTYMTKALRYGIQFDPVFLFGLIKLEPLAVKDVIQNMISGFQLSPSQKYFDFYSGTGNNYPFPYRDDADIDSNGVRGSLDYDQIKILLTNLGHNTSLFTPSETFHQLDNSLNNSNGVEVINIVGSGLPTLGQIIEKYALNILGIKIPEKDEILINGDTTVPLFSASLIDPARNLSLLGNTKVYYTNQKHGSLVIPGPALNLIKTLLNNISELPEGVSSEPFKLKGKQLSVHSPVNIHVYDSNGNHTGPTPDGDFEVNIPGSLYDTLDDAKFIWLPDDGIYNIAFEATGKGSFDFKIRKFEDDINTESILYEDIPIDVTSKGQTIYDTLPDQPPVLEIDNLSYNYFSILDENSSYDHTNPEISFNVNRKIIWPPNGKMVDVNITGNIIDDNPYLINTSVDDEYDLIEPAITTYNQTEYNRIIKLEASRKADDIDGRKYKINILVKDLAGNTAQQQFEVIVPHDSGK